MYFISQKEVNKMKKLIISCLFVVFCLGAEFMFSAPAVFEPGVPVTVDTTLAYSYAKVPYKENITRP